MHNIMAYDLQEQEQIESLKAFWRRYGNFILTLLTVVLLAFSGWRAWGWYQDRQAAAASELFDELRVAVTARDLERVRGASGRIFGEHASTAYAQMAALASAKAYVDAGDRQAARVPLRWAIDKARDPEYRQIARLRLAGLLLEDGAHEEALAALGADPSARFAGAHADRRGDILFALGRRDEARQAYGLALEKLDPTSPLRQIVQIKLDALGTREG
jgi:predicted negative regulator of RcsB-dependent stress response